MAGSTGLPVTGQTVFVAVSVATAAGSAARAAFTSSVITAVMVAREERMSFMVGVEWQVV
jgi:hypothetical protein